MGAEVNRCLSSSNARFALSVHWNGLEVFLVRAVSGSAMELKLLINLL